MGLLLPLLLPLPLPLLLAAAAPSLPADTEDCRTASQAEALVGGVGGGRCGEPRLLLGALPPDSSNRRRASGPPKERGLARR